MQCAMAVHQLLQLSVHRLTKMLKKNKLMILHRNSQGKILCLLQILSKQSVCLNLLWENIVISVEFEQREGGISRSCHNLIFQICHQQLAHILFGSNATRLDCVAHDSRVACRLLPCCMHLYMPHHLANLSLVAAIRQLNDISYTTLIAQGRSEYAQSSIVGSHALSRKDLSTGCTRYFTLSLYLSLALFAALPLPRCAFLQPFYGQQTDHLSSSPFDSLQCGQHQFLSIFLQFSFCFSYFTLARFMTVREIPK